MSEVLQFKPRVSADPHLSGEVKCIGCGHEWVAVADVGTVTLECPQCSANRGVWRYPVRASVGDLLYSCTCGCEALTAYKRGGYFFVKCMCCGINHTEDLFG